MFLARSLLRLASHKVGHENRILAADLEVAREEIKQLAAVIARDRARVEAETAIEVRRRAQHEGTIE